MYTHQFAYKYLLNKTKAKTITQNSALSYFNEPICTSYCLFKMLCKTKLHTLKRNGMILSEYRFFCGFCNMLKVNHMNTITTCYGRPME